MSRLKVLAAAFVSAPLVVVSANAVMATDDPPPPNPSAPDRASTGLASTPMITRNPDGTFTVQKEPPNGNSKDGLVIPPQVVVPFILIPQTKQ